jgi:hypothetical protein
MSMKELLFPAESRLFPGQRWLNISLRTLHLIGVAGIGSGILYPAPEGASDLYLYLTLASGLFLSLVSVWSNAIWLLQLRGQAIILKLLLLALIPVWPGAGVWLLIMVIVISGYIAHAPGDVRYYSIYHRRRIDALQGSNLNLYPQMNANKRK